MNLESFKEPEDGRNFLFVPHLLPTLMPEI